jgi:ribosomal protein S18 acetylase RimI-like enzyme
MDEGNKTALKGCRFLSGDYLKDLYEAFIAAFADYVVPFALTEAQFRNHIILNAVDLDRTIAYFDDGKIVGFSLNGFGHWHGRSTVYDAGTGVVPSHRRRGVSEAMFHMMLPVFKESGVVQCLLEVVTTNAGAVSLYEKLGYVPERTLALLQCDGELQGAAATPDEIEVRVIEEPEWEVLSTFWDGEPSWQNSIDAMNRSRGMKRILGAFEADECIGYIVYSSKFGRIAQIAVRRDRRRQGIGTSLVRAMQSETADGFSMQVINIDKSLDEAVSFFLNRGFYERLSQHEMVKTI